MTEGTAPRPARQTRPRTRCTWCENVANSREDVIPSWLLKRLAELHGRGAVNRRAGLIDDPDRVRVDTKQGLRLRLRIVCHECNTGWMHLLEDETIPVLGPRLGPVALPITVAEQLTLAFWAAKTAIMLQGANRKLGRPIPREHIETIYDARDLRPCVLPGQITVWLAKHRGPSVGLAYLVAFSVEPGSLRPVAEGHRYWVGLRIGTVAFHILGHTLRPSDAQVVSQPPGLVQIWPVGLHQIEWPPQRTFDDHQFEELARTSLPSANWQRGGIWIPPRPGARAPTRSASLDLTSLSSIDQSPEQS
jgi:hypothetical protein